MDERTLHILLVEDNPADADLLQEALAEVDHQPVITHVERMDEAVQHLKQGGPVDCVLLDLALPDSHGLATLQQVHCAAAYVPVIILTGLEDEALGIEAVRHGAQDYLVKGQNPPRMLMRAIHHAIERMHAQESLRRLNAWLEAANAELRTSRAAALNLMEDALTARRQTEQADAALRDSEERFRKVFDYAPTGIAITDCTGRFIQCNEAYCRLTGYRQAELEAMDFPTLIHPQDREPNVVFLQQLFREELPSFEIENRYVHKNGSLVWVHEHVSLLRDDHGQPTHIVALVTDRTERKQIEEDLRRAKEVAETANVAKSRFLTNMSHELRTPMNAILGMIDVALQRATDPAVQDCLQTARGSADLLLALLNDLLDSAKIESGKLELESAPFSLRRMLEQITRVLSVRASENGLGFSCRMPEGTPELVFGDRTRLQQILFNLAGNAIKFTDRGEVTIGVEQFQIADSETKTSNFQLEACNLRFSVRDTGIGIPLSVQEQLFQPFVQADASMSRRFGGTGLGLSICKSLVELMGGRIWVESEVDKGSTFCFTLRLPLAREPTAAVETPVTVATKAGAQLHILLVEDNPANQKVATYILQDRGHLVEIAGDGREAVRLTGQEHYDVVLMDIQMPEMGGLEATMAIRKREAERGKGEGSHPAKRPAARVPIIAMTAHASKADCNRCLAAGMDGYLSKPAKREELVATVEQLGRKAHCDLQPANGTSPIEARESRPEAESAISDPPPFDLDEARSRFGGEPTIFREMVAFFFSDGLKLLREIQVAAGTDDATVIEKQAHRLKGTVLYLCAEPAIDAVARVEALARSGDLTQAAGAIRAMEREIARLAEALRPYGPAAP